MDGSYIPQLCSSIMPGCTLCANSTVCLECDVSNNYMLDINLSTCVAALGYYLDSGSIPRPCLIIGCSVCQDAYTCISCSNLDNFITDPGNSSLCSCDNSFFFTLAPTN